MIVVTAIQGLIDAADEELKLRETSTTDPTKVRLEHHPNPYNKTKKK